MYIFIYIWKHLSLISCISHAAHIYLRDAWFYCCCVMSVFCSFYRCCSYFPFTRQILNTLGESSQRNWTLLTLFIDWMVSMCRLSLRCQIKETKLLTALRLTFPAWRNLTLPLVRGHIAVVLVFKHVRVYLVKQIITSIPALIICCCVCFARDVREPAHDLIIQSDRAAPLCLQPQPRTWDSCERGLLLQTHDPLQGQARKTMNGSHFLSAPVLKMHQDFKSIFDPNLFFSSFPSLEGRVTQIVHQVFWDILREQLSSDPPNNDHAVILLQEIKTVSAWRNRFKLSVTGKEDRLWLLTIHSPELWRF